MASPAGPESTPASASGGGPPAINGTSTPPQNAQGQWQQSVAANAASSSPVPNLNNANNTFNVNDNNNNTNERPLSSSTAAFHSHPPPPPTTHENKNNNNNTVNTSVPAAPATSASDDGTAKRPRDARLMHLILAGLGVSVYQERVPLQLLDFAYRYTAGVLGDALHLSAEGYGSGGSGGGGVGGGGGEKPGGGSRGTGEAGGSVSLAALRLAVASRLNYQFQAALPKEFMLELAQERNRIALPRVEREYGLRLPPERYCLTGTGWGLKDNWESEGDGDEDEDEGGEDMVDMFDDDGDDAVIAAAGVGVEGGFGGNAGDVDNANAMDVSQDCGGTDDNSASVVKNEVDAEGDQKMDEDGVVGTGKAGTTADTGDGQGEDKNMADACIRAIWFQLVGLGTFRSSLWLCRGHFNGVWACRWAKSVEILESQMAFREIHTLYRN